MSTAQVANTGIVGSATRVAQSRAGSATSMQSVDPLSGAYAPPARDQTPRFADEYDDFDTGRRQRRRGPHQDRVISFGGVLVSNEVGATIMQVQAASAGRVVVPFAGDAQRSIAIYEFNQALMGTAQILTNIGLSR